MSMITLPSGYQVPEDTYNMVFKKLDKLCVNNPTAVLGLWEKCHGMKDSQRFLMGKLILQQNLLIHQNDEVDQDIKEIALSVIRTKYDDTLTIIPRIADPWMCLPNYQRGSAL